MLGNLFLQLANFSFYFSTYHVPYILVQSKVNMDVFFWFFYWSESHIEMHKSLTS